MSVLADDATVVAIPEEEEDRLTGEEERAVPLPKVKAETMQARAAVKDGTMEETIETEIETGLTIEEVTIEARINDQQTIDRRLVTARSSEEVIAATDLHLQKVVIPAQAVRRKAKANHRRAQQKENLLAEVRVIKEKVETIDRHLGKKGKEKERRARKAAKTEMNPLHRRKEPLSKITTLRRRNVLSSSCVVFPVAVKRQSATCCRRFWAASSAITTNAFQNTPIGYKKEDSKTCRKRGHRSSNDVSMRMIGSGSCLSTEIIWIKKRAIIARNCLRSMFPKRKDKFCFVILFIQKKTGKIRNRMVISSTQAHIAKHI